VFDSHATTNTIQIRQVLDNINVTNKIITMYEAIEHWKEWIKNNK